MMDSRPKGGISPNRPVRGLSLKERIMRLSMPEPMSGCWLWLGCIQRNMRGMEYGRLMVGSRKNGTRFAARAHRVAYEVFKGEVADGLYVCHSCDNGLCVNPDHLWLGTASDNAKDAVNKGRMIPPPWRNRPPPPEE